MLRLSKLFICSLLLVGLISPARADSPITSPELISAVDRYLGQSFSGQSFTYKEARIKGQQLLDLMGKKGTSVGTVFDAVQTWNSVLFGIDSPREKQMARNFFNKKLARMHIDGDGGMNGAAARQMNTIFARLFDGKVKGITKTKAWKEFNTLKNVTNSPALYTVAGMFHHYIDMSTTNDGASKHSEAAALNWMQATRKILSMGTKASSHARQLLKSSLDYSSYYDGLAYSGHVTPKLTQFLTSRSMTPTQKLVQLKAMKKVLPAQMRAVRFVRGISL